MSSASNPNKQKFDLLEIKCDVSTGKFELSMSDLVAKRLVKIQKMIEHELEQLNQIRRFSPISKNSSNFVKAVRKARVNPYSKKLAFLAKIERLRLMKPARLELERVIGDMVHLKKWQYKTVAERKHNLTMIDAVFQEEYFTWRRKRDFKLGQKKRYDEFMENMNKNTLFFISSSIEDVYMFISRNLGFLKATTLNLLLNFGQLILNINDHDNNVTLLQSVRSCLGTRSWEAENDSG